eukprot:6723158-Alexandrium_andersonii.AAC.1
MLRDRLVARPPPQHLHRERCYLVQVCNVPEALAGLQPIPGPKAEGRDGHPEGPSSRAALAFVVVQAPPDQAELRR